MCEKRKKKKKGSIRFFEKQRYTREILETSSRRERNHALTFRSCHPISSPKSHIRPRMKLIYALFLLPSSEREVAREARGVHKSVDYLAVFESFLGKKKREEEEEKEKEKEKKERHRRTVNPFKEKKEGGRGGEKAASTQRIL